MLAAYDLDHRSSAVLPQTVQRLGFKPSRRVEILTTGRGRRRRHRGGTVEQELAEARRLRDERAARRAAAREESREPEPQPQALAGQDTDDSSGDEFEDASADLSGFRETLAQAQADLQENPVATGPASSSVQAQADESARQAVLDAAEPDGDSLTPAEQFFDDLRARLPLSEMTEEQWWDAHVDAINKADVGDQVALATQLKEDLQILKQDLNITPKSRRYFHELWSQMPEIIAELREEAEQQQRKPTGRQAIQQFIDAAETSGLQGDVLLQSRRRGSVQRSPSPIRTPGFEESGRFSDEASTISAIRDLSQSIVQDPRLEQEVGRLQGELSVTQDMLQDLQLADATTRSKTVKALEALTDASKKQIVKDRKLAPAEIAVVAENIKDRPAVRRMLQQGLVRPNDLVNEGYAAALQTQADTARKLPRRRTSKQVLLDRESVPSRSTRGLKYYRRARHVRPDLWR
jgi:hypothetical protein